MISEGGECVISEGGESVISEDGESVMWCSVVLPCVCAVNPGLIGWTESTVHVGGETN